MTEKQPIPQVNIDEAVCSNCRLSKCTGTCRSSNPVKTKPKYLTSSEKVEERQEWYTMLTTALSSKVVKQEKKRITEGDNLFDNTSQTSGRTIEELSESEKINHYHRFQHDIWLHARSFLHRTTISEEMGALNILRIIHIDPALRKVEEFMMDNDIARNPNAVSLTLDIVQTVLRRVTYTEGLYPTLKSFGENVPKYADPKIQHRLEILNAWTRNVMLTRNYATLLENWTGIPDLSLFTRLDQELSESQKGRRGSKGGPSKFTKPHSLDESRWSRLIA